MATVTVYADHALSGRIGSFGSSGAAFSTIAAGTGLVATTAVGAAQCGIDLVNYDIYENFHSFDTSVIGGDIVAAVTESLYAFNITTYRGSQNWEARRIDYGTGLTTADWVPGSQWSANTLCATLPGSAVTASARVDMVSTGAFAGQINRTGKTQIVLGSALMSGSTWGVMLDYFGTALSGSDSQDAKLVIETVPVLALNFGCGC